MSKFTSKAVALQKSISAVYTTVIQMKSIDYPDAEVETVEITALDGGVGECGGSGYFDPVATTHKNLTTDITTPPSTAPTWKILNSDGATTAWPFSGFLTKFTPKAEVGQFLMFDLKIRLTGLVTYPT
jgi:hypothetical protein